MSDDNTKKEKKKGKGESTIGRAQFENMLNEDTSSSEQEEEPIKIKRVGYIEMRKDSKNKKTKWKAVHCVLYGGSFFWYKNAKNVDPLSNCDLKHMDIENNIKVGNKDCFVIRNSEGVDVFAGFLGSSETNREAWVQDLLDAKQKEPNPPPSRDFVKVKKQGTMHRVKNKIASSTATSPLGKKVMKAIINEETTSLLQALKNIVKAEDQKKGEDMEKNIIKIAVKSYLLIEKKKLDPDEFLKADKPLRQAFELLCRCFNGRHRVQSNVLYEALVRIEQSLREAEEILTNLLAPFLTSKNLFRISSTFGVLADAKFLSRVFFRPLI